jgi:hypothetical protein
MMNSNIKAIDLAGTYTQSSNYLKTRSRINTLIDRYLAVDILSDRLTDLPTQFTHPHVRHWEPIEWNKIDRSQIVGIDPDLFLLVIAGATEIEAPIRAYSQESWEYLQAVHPQMAYFMGGEQSEDGRIISLGIWEKEERQHAPTFSKIYHLLSGEKIVPKPNTVKGYQAHNSAMAAVYHHTLSRISTEWGAVSVYLWLMAHSTGALQIAIAQPLQDEVNHLAKFWGFSRWAFGESYFNHLIGSTANLIQLLQHHQGERSSSSEIGGKTNIINGVELIFTFMRVMVRLRTWNRDLNDGFLNHLLGKDRQLSLAG